MSLDWTDSSWRDRYFGRPTRRRLPASWRSAERCRWDSEQETATRRAETFAAEVRAHARAQLERERVDRWQILVARFGAEAVTTVMRRVDASFELPAELQAREGDKQ